ncbi:hypothetical protein HDU83_004678 [Entophlyctis luteolus]|nr:hypothetical protein HDU83_004678 [Entophlyctis luteolus]
MPAPPPNLFAALVRLASKDGPDAAGLFDTERQLLVRLIYKTKSQHRHAKHFHHAAHAARILSKASHPNLDVRHIASQLLADANISSKKKLKRADYSQLPEDKIIELLFALRAIYSLHQQFLDVSLTAYCSFKAVAVQTFFLPTCLTFMAIFARLRLLSQSTLREVCECYEVIYLAIANGHDRSVPQDAESADSDGVRKLSFSMLKPQLQAVASEIFEDTVTGSDELPVSLGLTAGDSAEMRDRAALAVVEEELDPELNEFFSAPTAGSVHRGQKPTGQRGKRAAETAKRKTKKAKTEKRPHVTTDEIDDIFTKS